MRGRGLFMKYADLTAVEHIGRDEMSKVVGGISFGEFNSSRILAEGEGRANLQFIKDTEERVGVTNHGQLIQFGSDLTGYPGNVFVMVRFGTDVPPHFE
jgi:hypothetical protein